MAPVTRVRSRRIGATTAGTGTDSGGLVVEDCGGMDNFKILYSFVCLLIYGKVTYFAWVKRYKRCVMRDPSHPSPATYSPSPEAISVLDWGEIFLKYFMHIEAVHIYFIYPLTLHASAPAPFTHTVLSLVSP